MPLSRRLRYEILRRDSHTCRYCGQSAPDVKLTVDHVTPTALGGSDDPSNLVAACQDCNAGKSSAAPDAELVEQVQEDDIRWADAIKRAAERLRVERAEERDRHKWFRSAWIWDDGSFLPTNWDKSLDYWLAAGLSQDDLLDALDIASGNRNVAHESVFAYMGGIARKRIERLHEAARELIDKEGPNGA